MTKLKLWQNSNCDKTQIVTKLKLWQNSNCDKTQIVKNSKTQNVRKKLKLWQNSKTQIVTKLELWQISIYEEKTLKGSFSRNNLTPWQPMRCSLGSVLRFSQLFWEKQIDTQTDIATARLNRPRGRFSEKYKKKCAPRIALWQTYSKLTMMFNISFLLKIKVAQFWSHWWSCN